MDPEAPVDPLDSSVGKLDVIDPDKDLIPVVLIFNVGIFADKSADSSARLPVAEIDRGGRSLASAPVLGADPVALILIPGRVLLSLA